MKKTMIIALILVSILFLSSCELVGTYICTENEVNVILITDWSGSMLDKESVLRDSMKEFASKLLSNPKNKVGIVIYAFDTETWGSLPPTNDLNSIKAFVNSLDEPTGATCTGCGLKKAQELFDIHSTNHNQVVLFSDGATNVYKEEDGTVGYCVKAEDQHLCNNDVKNKAQALVNAHHPTIYTVYYAHIADDESLKQSMQDIATIGTGESFEAILIDGISEVYNNVVNKICTSKCDVNSPNYCIIGEERCNGKNIQICQDTNNDECGDSFITTETCGTGLTCVGNQCVCETNECTLGQQWCEGTGFRECVLDSNGCTIISSIIPCNQGEVCSGGVCGCPDASCAVGTSQCTTTTSYKECGVYEGVCPTWSGSTACPTGQICENGNCICPETGNNAGDRRCVGDGYQIYDVQGADLCPSWSPTIACPTGQSCNGGVCGCPPTGNNVGDKRCITSTGYQIYDVQGSNVCPSWSNSIECPTGQFCNGGECSCPTTVYQLGDTRCYDKYSYQLWSVYTGSCPSWGTPVDCPTGQECLNGICGCPDTACILGDTRCYGNTVQECILLGSCPEWSNKEVCGGDSICIKQSPAQCYQYFDSVEIITEEEYNYDDPITIDVLVYTQIQDLTGVKVYPSLKADGKTIQSFPLPLVMYDNKVSFSFDPITQSHDQFSVEVRLVKDTIEEIATKDLNIKKKLELRLSNTPPNYVREEARILVSVTPAGADYTLEDISILNPENINIQPSSITVSEIKFTPISVGTYTIQASAKGIDYAKTTDSIYIGVDSKTASVEYYIDNEEFSSIEGLSVDTGKHTLLIKSFISGGVAYDLDAIDLYLIPPEGEQYQTKMKFVKSTTGEAKAEFNLKKPSVAYRIKGYLQIFDTDTVDGENFPVNIPFKTVGEEDQILPDINYSWLIYGAIIVIVLTVLILLMVRAKRKK